MGSILAWLIQRYPTAKRQTLKRMVENRRVSINGRVARRLNEEIPEGAKVVVKLVERAPKKRLPVEIVFEDADLLVVNKPPGLLTSTNRREKRPTLLAAVREYLGDEKFTRVGLIHRLDRDASGLLVFSKTPMAYQSLKQQWSVHSVERNYSAIVHGSPSPRSGRIESRLVERADGTVYSNRAAGGEGAITDYETVKEMEGKSLLKVTLQTGRKHQIRVHLSERGTPIVGDVVYGKKGEGGDEGGMRLCAVGLAFDHPRTGRRVRFGIDAPW